MRRLALLTFLLLAGPAAALADASLSIHAEERGEVLTLQLPEKVEPHVFTLQHPDRLVVDIPALPKGALSQLHLPEDYHGTVKSLRVGRFNAGTTRIVFELAAPPGTVSTKTKVDAQSVVIIALNAPQAGETQRAEAPPKKAAKAKKAAQVKPEKKQKVAQAALPPAEFAVDKGKDHRPLIVIDAGHGGQDPGTTGPGGVREKDVVLAYALALKKALISTGRYHVYLTRPDDHFILLHDRVKRARDAHGDLFMSLHADSAPEEDTSGLSVYTLSEQASDAETAALAQRENSVDAVYGLDISGQSKDVADILVSLAQRDTNNRSAALADSLLSALDEAHVHLLSANTHRFAGFAVLKAPDIPSVLVETGFLSNPEDEQQLQNKAHRTEVVEALVEGIDQFFAGQPQTHTQESDAN